MRLLPLLAFACFGSAAAQDLEHDVLVLTSGERLVGDIVDLRDGRYWMLLMDGRMVSVELRTAARVEMAGGSVEPIPMEDLPLPDWYGGAVERKRPIAGGVDVGLTQGARVRFRFRSAGVAHVDLKAGLGLLVGGGVGPALLTGLEIAFLRDSPVHFTLSGSGGAATLWGGLYPFVGVGTGLQVDPSGPVELHLGVTAGTTFGTGAALMPDLTVSWVW